MDKHQHAGCCRVDGSYDSASCEPADADRAGRRCRSQAVVLAQFDSADAAPAAELCASIATTAGAETFSTDDPADGEAMMAARHAAYPALEALGTTLLDDVAVATHRLPGLLESIGSIARRTGVVIGTFGHVADGNLHPTMVYVAA